MGKLIENPKPTSFVLSRRKLSMSVITLSIFSVGNINVRSSVLAHIVTCTCCTCIDFQLAKCFLHVKCAILILILQL